jgi:hypothetical protein
MRKYIHIGYMIIHRKLYMHGEWPREIDNEIDEKTD